MKTLIILSSFFFAQLSMASVCGTVDDISTDYDGMIKGFTVKNEKKDYRITRTKNPELVKMLKASKGYFVCLDKFETYTRKVKNKNEIRTYATTTEWRLWKAGKMIASVPFAGDKIDEEIKNMARELGEYVGEGDKANNLKLVALKSKDIPKKLQKVVAKLIRKRDELLKDGAYPGGVYESTVLAITHTKTNEVIGYLLRTEDYIDHPLHDGSGINIYLNKKLEIVYKEEWVG